MKKNLALLLALGLLAGCAPQQGKPAASGTVSGAASGAVSGAASGKTQYEPVTLFVPNESADGLNEQTVQLQLADPENKNGPAADLIEALVADGALPEGTELNAAVFKDGKLRIDLNQSFAQGLLQSGTAGETMILASLINTLWAYYSPDELTLTADGEPLETGHNIYDEPFVGPFTLD